MFRISDRDLQQRAYLTATKEPKVKRPYYSLTVPYPFDAKKLNLPKYSIPKETAADIILGIADLFLNLAFPGWEDVDL